MTAETLSFLERFSKHGGRYILVKDESGRNFGVIAGGVEVWYFIGQGEYFSPAFNTEAEAVAFAKGYAQGIGG